ncbi:MAG: bifunctional glutamate N-acetyltransferase/amino-acid acetyltransferase ArgJ [Chloroflexi bacterium]|nr:MAG: bifunctional glutamate N-acetyltransferase/amino-acid acetyltransferase ArgJ [Chloroflexota bacterium]
MHDVFTLAPGFRTAATACGLKKDGALDLTLIVADAPCSAAGVFTTNRVKAAPVLYDREVLSQSAGQMRAIIANAGCANACTGDEGKVNTRQMAALAAEVVGARADQVLVLSTGVIGRQLDMTKVAGGIAQLAPASWTREANLASRAIMTTDTKPKTSSATGMIAGHTVTVAGMAKGAGMIHPGMATMLSIITTDAQVAPELLHTALKSVADMSFNRISVDGDMSTNDTVLLLASGVAGVTITDNELADFVALLRVVCIDLAKKIARDGEGATKLVEIRVTGAAHAQMAHRVADSIACSPLVKTAIHGNDPNWGRVVCAAGYSGAEIDPDTLTLDFGLGDEQIRLVAAGMPLVADLNAASNLLKREDVFITLDLGLGDAATTVWTCDFSKEYVEVNAHYTT